MPFVNFAVDRTAPSDAKHAKVWAQALEYWRELGYAKSTVQSLGVLVSRYRAWCRSRHLDEVDKLTKGGVTQFARWYAKTGNSSEIRHTIVRVRGTLHTWAKTLIRLGCRVPPWTSRSRPHPFEDILGPYCEFRRRWRGVAETSLYKEHRHLVGFLTWLRRRRRSLEALSVRDIEQYVVHLSSSVARATVPGHCSTLRAFLRFLHARGLMGSDVSKTWVMAPVTCRSSWPPRVRSWRDVRRVLDVIDRRHPLGKRDYAALLLMAAYGMGVGEAVSLQLDDLDWHGGILHVRRPKTSVEIVLPMLGPVARALASYLRHGRPRAAKTRAVFINNRAPHPPLRTTALRDRFRKYALAAGIVKEGERLGTHIIRHSHAARQVEMAAPPKVVSDILGHENPDSLSTYARVATERLREICLPLP